MKNHRILLGVTIPILCLVFVSVSLSGVMRERAHRQNAAATETTAKKHNQPLSGTAAPAVAPHAGFLMVPLDIERLTNDADLIGIGRINSVRKLSDTGQGPQERTIATLALEKLVKGEMNTQSVEIELSTREPHRQRVEPSHFGMFFVKKTAQGRYHILDPEHPYVIAPMDAVVIEGPALDRVVSIVGQLLDKSNTIATRQEAVKILGSARTERATALLRKGTKDADTVVRMQSISALLNRDDLAALELAEPILLRPPARTEQYLLDNVSAALEGIKDPRAIPVLQRLLRSSNLRTRLGAVSALRQMHIAEAIESLVIALGDTNRDVRYEAVIGLAELTGDNQWAPAVDTFAQNEQRYLDHWREWSRTR